MTKPEPVNKRDVNVQGDLSDGIVVTGDDNTVIVKGPSDTDAKSTLYDKYLIAAKNHPILSKVILLAMLIIGIGAVVGAVSAIASFVVPLFAKDDFSTRLLSAKQTFLEQRFERAAEDFDELIRHVGSSQRHRDELPRLKDARFAAQKMIEAIENQSAFEMETEDLTNRAKLESKSALAWDEAEEVYPYRAKDGEALDPPTASLDAVPAPMSLDEYFQRKALKGEAPFVDLCDKQVVENKEGSLTLYLVVGDVFDFVGSPDQGQTTPIDAMFVSTNVGLDFSTDNPTIQSKLRDELPQRVREGIENSFKERDPLTDFRESVLVSTGASFSPTSFCFVATDRPEGGTLNDENWLTFQLSKERIAARVKNGLADLEDLHSTIVTPLIGASKVDFGSPLIRKRTDRIEMRNRMSKSISGVLLGVEQHLEDRPRNHVPSHLAIVIWSKDVQRIIPSFSFASGEFRKRRHPGGYLEMRDRLKDAFVGGVSSMRSKLDTGSESPNRTERAIDERGKQEWDALYDILSVIALKEHDELNIGIRNYDPNEDAWKRLKQGVVQRVLESVRKAQSRLKQVKARFLVENDHVVKQLNDSLGQKESKLEELANMSFEDSKTEAAKVMAEIDDAHSQIMTGKDEIKAFLQRHGHR